MDKLKELFIELGYTKEEYEEIRNSYSINGLKEETLINKVKENYAFLITLGYNKEDVIKMTKSSPSIYSYSIKNIKQKIEDMEELGYSKEDVIKMTKTLPSIYSLSIENIKQKIEFYDSIGMHFLAVTDAKKLMQSTKLSYARYMFFKEKGINIDEKNYSKLFVNQKYFERTYGISKEKILEMYPYEAGQDAGNKKEKSTQGLGIESEEAQKDTGEKIKMSNTLLDRTRAIIKENGKIKGEEN